MYEEKTIGRRREREIGEREKVGKTPEEKYLKEESIVLFARIIHLIIPSARKNMPYLKTQMFSRFFPTTL